MKKNSRFVFIAALIILLGFVLLNRTSTEKIYVHSDTRTFWPIQSIDTMKFSRDVAREKLNDPTFDAFIERNVSQIAATGATHVAIGTPYDPEFVPFTRRWVDAARRNNVKVWFRGNMSGWEGWFGYQKINREEHTKGVVAFIESNPDLFEDGDLFTSCPECENGGPGDPRHNGDAAGHTSFLIGEYLEVKNSFKRIGKNVEANTYSMNGDVAKLIMDRKTTSNLDGRIVVDHYVGTPERTIGDVVGYGEQSGGMVILGEFGVPIPDLHGVMSQEDQAEWIDEFFRLAIANEYLEGVNYWTSYGGSSELWNSDGSPRKAVETITSYFKPHSRKLYVETIYGTSLSSYGVSHDSNVKTFLEKDGSTSFIFINPEEKVTLIADNYHPIHIKLGDLPQNPSHVTLQPVNESITSRIWNQLRTLVD